MSDPDFSAGGVGADAAALARVARRLRRRIVEVCAVSGGHLSTSYSCVEILTCLYYAGILRIDPERPDWSARDRFVLSKGHGEIGLYATLADRGFFPDAWLETRYRTGDCLLGGHVDCRIPGVDVTTGALGHGLGVACGMALAARMEGADILHYVLLGDAECSEGSVWEAAMFAARHRLGNLVAIVDANRIGALDFTCNYLALDPLAEKWRAFGWEALEVDGHDLDALRAALARHRARCAAPPLAVIAHTVKGKGVSVFEDDPVWHTRPVGPEHLQQARRELAEPGDAANG